MWLHFTHSALGMNSQKSYQPGTSIKELKQKIYQTFGTTPDNMKLILFDKSDTQICEINDDNQTLAGYGVVEGMRIHVVDLDAASAASLKTFDVSEEDLKNVQKFELTEDQYNERGDTFRKWKERMIDSNPKVKEEKLKKELALADEDEEFKNWIGTEKIAVGARCEIQNELQARGTIKFLGKTKFSPGCWVGIQLDEALGKNDGSVNGVKYFSCESKKGLFVKKDKIQVGDFPEKNILDELDEL